MAAGTEAIQDTNLIVGNTYRVVLNDCCIEGEITGRLDGVLKEEDDDDLISELKFDFGSLTRWWQCEFFEVGTDAGH